MMENVLRDMRKTMLRVTAAGKDGNLQSCFSSLEILWALYDHFMPTTAMEMENEDKSQFVLSKGQSNLALMVVLAEKGFIDSSELYTFCKFDSRISMQADRTKFNGIVETSAGSLGHGFPMAAGMAWGKKIKDSHGTVYCLAGDGEMNEGTMWEAAIFAASERLDNLCLIIDHNHSIERMIKIGDLGRKLDAFGFEVFHVNGHHVPEITDALRIKTDKPKAIIADTVRGWGSKTLMEDRSWFHRYPKAEELDILLEEVDVF